MKNIKVLFIFIAVILATGCSADYNLTITDEKSVEEVARMIESNERLIKYYDNIDLHLSNQIKAYKQIDMFKDYYYEKNIGDNTSYLEMSKKYSDLSSYVIESPFFKKVFQDAIVTNTESYTSFQTTGKYYYDNIYGKGGETEPNFYVNEIDIKIKFYNEIIDSNADDYDEKNNILIWKITEEDKEKSIYFKVNNEKRYDIIILDYFMKNKITIITLLISGIVLISIGMYIFIKMKKNKEV